MVTFLNSTGQVVHAVSIDDNEGQTHASILPSHVALRIETPQLMLESNSDYTIRVHRGVAESHRRGCGHVLSEFDEWQFRTDGMYIANVAKTRESGSFMEIVSLYLKRN